MGGLGQQRRKDRRCPSGPLRVLVIFSKFKELEKCGTKRGKEKREKKREKGFVKNNFKIFYFDLK